MKICQKCNKAYDLSWDICVVCNGKLTAIDDTADFLKRIVILEKRLIAVEKAVGITTAKEVPAVAAMTTKVSSVTVKPQAKKSDMETTIGLYWLNRIGFAALLLGVAFFLKYAFDNQWIGITARIIMGLVTGLALITGSEIARKKKYDVFSQGLHGAGAGILYLSIFAAHGFYHLISAIPAFLLLGVVAVFCGFWAVRNNWLSSAVLSLIAGYFTPLLLMDNTVGYATVLIYLTILNLGTLVITAAKPWKAVGAGSLLLSCFVFLTWASRIPDTAQYFYFITTFIIFTLAANANNFLKRSKTTEAWDLVILGSTAFFTYFGMASLLVRLPALKTVPGVLPLSMAVIYLLFSVSAFRRRSNDKNLVLCYVLLAISFVTLTIPLQLKHGGLVIGWSLESALLIWIGFRAGFPLVRKIGIAIGAVTLFIAWASLGYTPYRLVVQPLFMNERFISWAIMAALLFVTSHLYKTKKAEVQPFESRMGVCAFILSHVCLLIMLSLESQAVFAYIAQKQGAEQLHLHYQKMFSARHLTLSILWVLYALAQIIIGMAKQNRALRLMGLVVLAAAILKVFFIDLSQLDKLYRIISFIGLGGVLLLASLFYQKYKNEIKSFTLKDKS